MPCWSESAVESTNPGGGEAAGPLIGVVCTIAPPSTWVRPPG